MHPGFPFATGALFAAALAFAMPAPALAQAPAQPEVSAALDLYTARLFYSIARYTEGIVQIRIDLDASGRLARQTLLRGSGNALLDRHAANILQSAVPQTDIPDGLRNKPFYIAITIDFSS